MRTGDILSMTLAALGLFMVMALSSGCASRVSIEDPVAERHAPPDFHLDILTVVSGATGPDAPFHARPGRFVLTPDGALHGHWGDEVTLRGMPPVIRMLSRAEIDALWQHAGHNGFLSTEASDPIGNLEMVRPPDGQITQLVSVTMDGRVLNFARTWIVDDEPDPEMTRLIRAIGHLAWGSDLERMRPPRLPRRYDFGADPYARYRAGGAVD